MNTSPVNVEKGKNKKRVGDGEESNIKENMYNYRCRRTECIRYVRNVLSGYDECGENAK